MDNQLAPQETKSKLDNGHNFAIIGLIISFLAFSLSVTTPLVRDVFAPPPIEIEVEEETSSTSEWVLSYIFGSSESVEEKEQEEREVQAEHWMDYWSFIIVVIALGGLLNATIAILQKQSKYIAGTAIFFGISAIVVQYILMALAIFLVFIVLVFLLSAIGVDF